MQRLLNRLKIRQKYAIIGLLAFIVMVVPTTLVVMEKSADLNQARAAADALTPARQVLAVIRLNQQMRGLSSAYLSGNIDMKAELSSVGESLHAAYNQAITSLEAGGDADVLALLQNLRRQTDDVAAQVQAHSLSPSASFAAYTAVIARQLALLTDMVSDSGLDLDAHADTYHLINGLFGSLPSLTELLGQARATGAGLLAGGSATTPDRLQLAAITALAADRLEQWSAALAEAANANAVVDSTLSATAEQANHDALRVLALTRQEIIDADEIRHASTAYFRSMTEAIDAQFGLALQTADTLDTLLKGRASRAAQHLWALVGMQLVLTLAALWLAMLISRHILNSLSTSLRVARTVATGDLTTRIRASGKDEVQQLLGALDDMSTSLIGIVSRVRGATDSIATAASQIAAGNHDLSNRTVAQAASLEETATSMAELTSTVAQNSDNTRMANELTRSATEVARNSGDTVQKFVTTMSAIREASSRITEIIGIIDGIAFQTNILALNAAVEAARAGEAGKGFAVVAAEVRNLAQRTASSAQEVRQLIAQSTAEIDAGSQLADTAGDAMREVLGSIERLRAIMDEIAVASTEQSTGINQVSVAVAQMDGATQQNAALVQEADAAAHSLNDQAAMLVQTVKAFRLPGVSERHHEHAHPQEDTVAVFGQARLIAAPNPYSGALPGSNEISARIV